MPIRNRKQSANTHDKRHENGLAPPAVPKTSKSRADAPTESDVAAALLHPSLAKSPDTPDSDESDQQSSPDASADGTFSAPHMAGSSKTSSEGGGDNPWDASADVTADEQESVVAGLSHTANGNSVPRQDGVSIASQLDTNTTIISPQPLRDVLAVLLLLLQLPPSVLTLIQIAYAFITSGQSLSTFSLSSRPSWHDWFQGHGGNPSIVTTLITDLIFMLIWFMVTSVLPIVRDITLDLASSVIAMSLGGGTVTNGCWSHSVACLSAVTLPHMLRSRLWKRFAAEPLRSAILKTNTGLLIRLPTLLSAKYSQHGWLRSILELHILAQGAVRVIRRWIDRQPGTASVRRGEPEIIMTATGLTTGFALESGTEGVRNISSDGRQPGPSPAAREQKEKNVSSGKKRRKQGNFVRSQQPFWAAIASTKVTVRKEMEHTQATRDASDASAVDLMQRTDWDGTAVGIDDRIWITNVDQTEVSFVGLISSSSDTSEQNGEAGPNKGALSVRVNETHWSHFEYRAFDDTIKGTTKRAVKGRIYGLTPSESFLFDFMDRNQARIICSTHLVTRSLPISDVGTTNVAPALPQPQDTLRPSSPTTTLKKATASAEHQLSELRNRSKKMRKDHKASNANLKKEVDAFENRLTTFNGADERQRQRQAQFRQNIKQADEAVTLINQQIDDLAEIPQSERHDHELKARIWQEESAKRALALEELEKAKADGERQIAALRAEHANVRQKLEKGETKLVNQQQKRDNLQALTMQARREKSRWDAQRAATIATWQNKEAGLIRAIQYLDGQRQEIEARTAQLQQQSYFFDGQNTVQHTPESQYTALAGNANLRTSPFSALQYPLGVGTSPVHSHTRENSAVRQNPRGRSSSMLSAISGFTEDETGPGASFADFGDPARSPTPTKQMPLPVGAELGQAGLGPGGSPRANYSSGRGVGFVA